MTKAEAKKWMEENAEWYSQHREFPVGDIAEQATALHARPQDHEEYLDFVNEQFYTQALRIFTSQKLDIRKDGQP